MTSSASPVRVDLGCGDAKRPGYIGIDFVAGPEVDHVIDLTTDRYPFDDASVDEVFSSHFLEHIEAPNHVFAEIGRIAKDGARIRFWTPYAFSDEASFYGHLHHVTEEEWLHFCLLHRDAHATMLGGRWLLHHIDFVVRPSTVADLRAHGIDVDFAIKYFKGVVAEFGVDIEFRRALSTPAVEPVRTWSTSRDGERHPFDPEPAGGQIASGAATRAGETPSARPGPLRRAARLLPAPVRTKLRTLVR